MTFANGIAVYGLSSSAQARGEAVVASVEDSSAVWYNPALMTYLKDYELYFDTIDQWLSQVENLLYFGRQGLFAHDNTHHALYMGYCATSCLVTNGQFDRDRWRAFRQVFETHVVED